MYQLPFKHTRNGGMTFLRIGNLQLSWCVTRKKCPTVALPLNVLVAGAIVGSILGSILGAF